MHTAVIVCYRYLKAQSKPGCNYSNMISLQIRALEISLQNYLLVKSNRSYHLVQFYFSAWYRVPIAFAVSAASVWKNVQNLVCVPVCRAEHQMVE